MMDLIKCPECGELFNPAYLDQVATHLHDEIAIDETIKGELVKIDDNYYDPEDINNLKRLQRQLMIKENLSASMEECANIWQRHSADLAASWLDFPKNDEDILRYIKSSDYFTNFHDYMK